MTQPSISDAARGERGGYKVDVSRGERIGRVSSEWFSRPADERYLSLSELFDSVRRRADRSQTRTAESAAIRVDANRDDAEKLTLIVPGADVPLVPTHWSFSQLASLVGAPATYLRDLPAPLAGINLQYGLTSHRAELVKTLEMAERAQELLAGCGWLPEPLRTQGGPIAVTSSVPESGASSPVDSASGESASGGYETAVVVSKPPADDDTGTGVRDAVAAE
jgi:hypothetical protein